MDSNFWSPATVSFLPRDTAGSAARMKAPERRHCLTRFVLRGQPLHGAGAANGNKNSGLEGLR
jgi:hypothetical protein